jgi:non-heme Fe2+,alpha-ketoglutarate-dependent halogenase
MSIHETRTEQMPNSPKLTQDEIASYKVNGFVGPFDLDTRGQIGSLRRLVDDELLVGESPIYGIKSGRDWHLASRAVYDVCTDPAIVERVADLLGPDLLLWRSQLFYKKAGDGETAWHQDHSFPGPSRSRRRRPRTVVSI